jgi:hypothetical protein
VRTLIYSCAAISADLGVGAALGDQGHQLLFPGAELPRARHRRLSRPGIGEHQGVLGGGGNAHRRAAFLGGPRPVRSKCLPGLAQLFLPAGLEPVQIGQFLVPANRGARGL